MWIEVTQAHIDRARTQLGEWPAACLCPVALALAEKFPHARLRAYQYPALVNAGAIRIGRAPFDPPPSVTAFVIAYDNGDPVAPFSFEL